MRCERNSRPGPPRSPGSAPPYLQNETNQAQAGFLATYELYGSGWQQASGLVARFEAVTPDDIMRVARTYVRHIQWVVLGDPEAAAPPLFVDP